MGGDLPEAVPGARACVCVRAPGALVSWPCLAWRAWLQQPRGGSTPEDRLVGARGARGKVAKSAPMLALGEGTGKL